MFEVRRKFRVWEEMGAAPYGHPQAQVQGVGGDQAQGGDGCRAVRPPVKEPQQQPLLDVSTQDQGNVVAVTRPKYSELI